MLTKLGAAVAWLFCGVGAGMIFADVAARAGDDCGVFCYNHTAFCDGGESDECTEYLLSQGHYVHALGVSGAYAVALAMLFLPATGEYMASMSTDAPAMQRAAAWLEPRYRAGDVVTVGLPQTVNIAKYYAGREGFAVDARVFLTPTPEGGQPIHTTSLHAEDLLEEGPHGPPRDAQRWWRLETRKEGLPARKGWRRVEVEKFEGPPGTREVAGSEEVWLELFERERGLTRGSVGRLATTFAFELEE